MSDDRIATPYAEMALHYLPEWSPVPVRTFEGTKRPMVSGFSGYHGAYVQRADAVRWMLSPRLAEAQIGLRLPKNVIGIDIDRYAGKAGERTSAALQAKWGTLEPTWSSTSRTDGSGIFLYRLPDGVSADNMRDPKAEFSDGSPLGGLEVIRYCHRFVTCYPTFHGREGGIHQYLWFNPDLETDDENQVWGIPEDLPYLKEGWCVGLSTGRTYEMGNTEFTGKPSEWFATRPNCDGPLCEAMQRTLDNALAEVIAAGKAGGCYPTTNRAAFQIVRSACDGHTGGLFAVKKLWKTYEKAMLSRTSDRRSPSVLLHEFTNSLRGAIQGLPASKYSNDDECDWGVA